MVLRWGLVCSVGLLVGGGLRAVAQPPLDLKLVVCQNLCLKFDKGYFSDCVAGCMGGDQHCSNESPSNIPACCIGFCEGRGDNGPRAECERACGFGATEFPKTQPVTPTGPQ
jgi:hypothetical protein